MNLDVLIKKYREQAASLPLDTEDSSTPILLDKNENALGTSKKVSAAIHAAMNVHRYPSVKSLTQKIADKFNLETKQIFLSNGSDNAILKLCRLFLKEGDEAIIQQHAFFVMQKALAHQRIPTLSYKHIDDVAQLIKPSTKMIYIDNPNNPTGQLIQNNCLEKLMAQLPKNILVVLDEAYSDYVDADKQSNALDLLKKHENLIILRTFSKAYGLAGMRIAFVISSARIVKTLRDAHFTRLISGLSLAAGEAALDDHEHLALSAENNRLGRIFIEHSLTSLNIEYFPSQANFVTFRCENKNKKEALYQYFVDENVFINPLNEYELGQYLRLSIGKPEENIHIMKLLNHWKHHE